MNSFTSNEFEGKNYEGKHDQILDQDLFNQVRVIILTRRQMTEPLKCNI